MKSCHYPMFLWCHPRLHTPGWKRSWFRESWEQKSDARIPVIDVEEEFLMMMLLSFPCTILFQMRTFQTMNGLWTRDVGPLLFPAFPQDGFFKNGFSSENGFLSILPRTSERRIFSKAVGFGIRLFWWTFLWWTFLLYQEVIGFLWKLSGRRFLLVNRTFDRVKRLLRWSFHRAIWFWFSLHFPTGCNEVDFQMKHLMAFVFAAARELRLHWRRWDFNLAYGESTIFFKTRRYFRQSCIL